jgi:hypothetical protein
VNNDQMNNLKQLLAAFVSGIQQTGILAGVQPTQDVATLAEAEQLRQRIAMLEQAVVQMGERTKKLEQALEAHPQNLYTREEMMKYLREQGMGGGMTKEEVLKAVMDDPKVSGLIKDVVTEELEPRLEDYDSRAKEIAEEVVSESDPFANMRRGSTAWNNIEEAVDRVLDDKDFDDIVTNAIDNIDLHDKLDESRLVDMVESNMDIDDKVNDLINEYDFSDALRNTLADESVREAIEELVLKALVKRLSGEAEAKAE